jgi:hypothetical protein
MTIIKDEENNMTLSKIAEQIDMFYEDSGNRRIPLIEAYCYILERIKGSARQELDSLAANLSKRHNQKYNKKDQ